MIQHIAHRARSPTTNATLPGVTLSGRLGLPPSGIRRFSRLFVTLIIISNIPQATLESIYAALKPGGRIGHDRFHSDRRGVETLDSRATFEQVKRFSLPRSLEAGFQKINGPSTKFAGFEENYFSDLRKKQIAFSNVTSVPGAEHRRIDKNSLNPCVHPSIVRIDGERYDMALSRLER
jgi:hypothetical protein